MRGRGRWTLLSERRLIFLDHTRAIVHEQADHDDGVMVWAGFVKLCWF